MRPDRPDFLFERSFAAPQLAARAVARRMTVGPASDDARAERAAARAERLQTSTVDETLVDIAQGADSVSGGESSEDGASDDDGSVDGGATPGGGGSEWKSRGRRKRDVSAKSMFKCQRLPPELPGSCKETSTFCENANPLWGKLGLTNIPGLAETSRKKGGERFALSQSIKQAMTNINILSTRAGLSQGPRAPAGGAIVAHVLAPWQEVRVFRNPANHAETTVTVDAASAASMRDKHPNWEVVATTNAIHTADADPAPANANRESNDEGAACAARADGVIPTSLNGFGFDADALVAAWEESFEVEIDGVIVRCAPLRVWTSGKRRDAWASVQDKRNRDNLSNKFGEWLGAYWALTHEVVLPDGVKRRVKNFAKAGRELHKEQTGGGDLTFEIVARVATARANERARARASEGASAPTPR